MHTIQIHTSQCSTATGTTHLDTITRNRTTFTRNIDCLL
jgi:hypothetical protein